MSSSYHEPAAPVANAIGIMPATMQTVNNADNIRFLIMCPPDLLSYECSSYHPSLKNLFLSE